MRLAILAASSYTGSNQVSELSTSEVDLDLLGQRLGEQDAGFAVHIFRAERGLAEAVEQVIAEAGEPIDELFFYFLGYAVVTDERGPALLLAGERLGTFSLKRLRRVLGERAARGLAVLDTVIALDPAADPKQGVEALSSALVNAEAPVNLIASARADGSGVGRSPFTSLFELVLDWHSVKSIELSAEGLYGAMRAEEPMFAELASAQYFAGSEPFVVLRGAAPASLPPPAPEPSETAVDDSWQEAVAPSADERTQTLLRGKEALGRGEHEAALTDLQSALRTDPRDADTYHAILGAFEKAGNPDGSFNAASVLDALGAADVHEGLLVSAHRPEGLLPAQGVLSEEDWKNKRFSPERDADLDAAFAALGAAALEVGVETARRKRRMPALDPSTAQDLEKSTTTLARTLAWSARLLGFVRPRFHVLDSVTGGLDLAAVSDPTFVAGKALGSGLTLPELVFLWSRTLILLRPEHRVLSLLTEPDEIEAMLRATVVLGGQGEKRGLDSDTKLFVRSLRRHLRGPGLETAAEAARKVMTPRLGARLAHFKRTVSLAGARAGLLASGNLELAIRMTERFPVTEAGPIEAQIGDLMRFSVSPDHAALRERIGVSVKER